MENNRIAAAENFIIITGGPGVGKTTLLNELQRAGFNFVTEAATIIIQQQMARGGDALPWRDKEQYCELMLKHSVEHFRIALDKNDGQMLFFDRGIPDTLAYCKLAQLPISPQLEKAVDQYRYHKEVFILPPWAEIYHTDNERKQDFEEAIETFNVLSATYRELNYCLIEVPKTNPTERARFILERLSAREGYVNN